MKRDVWTVGDHAERPAGNPGECFYCQRKAGEQHAADCVMRRRTVVIRASVELVVDVPETWSANDIEFQRNESSMCANNLIHDLQALSERAGCLCQFADFEFVREATAEDEEAQQLRVTDLQG